MSKKKFLINNSLSIEIFGGFLTEEQINKVIPFGFNGKDDFIRFYLAHNGVYFPDGVEVSRSCFYELKDNDYDELEIECFYDIGDLLERMWNSTIKEYPEEKEFTTSHFPFARDAAGNEFFIEILTGSIIYVSWEYGISEGKVLVAPNFKEFCLAIEPYT